MASGGLSLPAGLSRHNTRKAKGQREGARLGFLKSDASLPGLFSASKSSLASGLSLVPFLIPIHNSAVAFIDFLSISQLKGNICFLKTQMELFIFLAYTRNVYTLEMYIYCVYTAPYTVHCVINMPPRSL